MADEFGFAPPAFKPDESLLQLKRSLRDLKLAERGNGFELRGKRVLELQVQDAAIHARIPGCASIVATYWAEAGASAGP